ncbi:hypothetical protein UFOVP1004_52 [uncultured Caudovirales phage]|uniref:Uncharacterized protein n=1 Tax=uncultured Caudovirales phage TaxID=2100421 RepID=A0A6J5Q3Q8_9CAUD|nr:hypothetical protein UFOVP1004_52 [uncultured Caudovirales phage]
MELHEAWGLYLEPGGKSVDNRNRIVELMYGPLTDWLVRSVSPRYAEHMLSEIGVVLVQEVENATCEISVAELVVLIRKKSLATLDYRPERDSLVKLTKEGLLDVGEFYIQREREEWKTGPDSSVDDPTIRQRPFSASLLAAEKSAEATGAEGVLVRLARECGLQ